MVNKDKATHPLVEWTQQVVATVESFDATGPNELSPQRLKKARKTLSEASQKLQDVVAKLDPVRQPSALFDPAKPDTVGMVVALALVSQPRVSLEKVDSFYGSGIYALYYKGGFDAYAPISGMEHPIYVGKADPESQTAKSPIEQGEKIAKRLKEHLKSISKARNLSAADFECRFLVVSSGMQEAAERHLISLYRPVWNKETKICFGIGKHGDSSETRDNGRSPWDTLHPGREWAEDATEDQLPEHQIRELLTQHFSENQPLKTREEAIDRFLRDMCQH